MSILSIYLAGCLVSFVCFVFFITKDDVIILHNWRELSYEEIALMLITISASWVGVVILIYSFLAELDWNKKPFGDD